MTGRLTTRRLARALTVGLVLALLALTGCSPAEPAPEPTWTPPPPGRSTIGPTKSGLPWSTGIWLGGEASTASVQTYQNWAGRPTDIATTYVARESFQTIAGSEWHITTFDGFEGRLAMGLPLLPDSGEGSLAEVGKGGYDWVWRDLATLLQKNGRGDSIIRIGLEGNGFGWGPWGADQRLAADYRAAFRRVATVMKEQAPELLIDFNIACGVPLTGGNDRLDAITELYPGDDVVDIVGCDIYDQYSNRVASAEQWPQVARPATAPGPDDLADFAREHDKLLSIPEWGLWKSGDHGGGDNPAFIEAIHAYLTANQDILAYEAYFDEPADYIENSLFRGEQAKTKGGETYRELFSV